MKGIKLRRIITTVIIIAICIYVIPIIASMMFKSSFRDLYVGIEKEISELEDDEQIEFLNDLGISESGVSKLIKESYNLLGLMSFLTAGPEETRAWTIKIGTNAVNAAGKIHSDIQRGFIRAETISYDKLMECNGSLAIAREKGFIRSEGKEYVVKDGDVMNFLFNV